MIIYVECVIINNFFIDTLIAYLSLITLRRSVKVIRLILGSIIGSLYALVTPLIEFKGDIVLKFLVAFLLCLIYAKPLNLKKYMLLCLAFLAYSFAFGGVLIAISNMSQPLKEVITSPNNINVGLGATLFLLVSIFSRSIIIYIKKSKVKEENVKKVIINTDKKIIKERAYYDSGNTLYYKGLYPVIVMDESLKQEGMAVGSIKVSTLVGSESKDVYKLSKIMIENRSYDGVYCIYNKLSSGYKVLLHNDTY